MRAIFSPGDQVGKWRLLDLLGTGGNGEVWRATEAGEPIALKIVSKKTQTEPYQRFIREVEASVALGAIEGVLPVYETHLPASPSRRNPAWIAMPIATPVRDALEDARLDAIVTAVHAFATALALLAERGVAHRDIKPGNLYSYEGRWVVGDFGLVSLPEAAALTEDRLGPFGYMPDEMFSNAKSADGRAVDVFQLAKTFVVLVARQPYPPQGHIPAGSSGALGRFAVHPRIQALEELVDRCTRRDPDQRPRMDAVAQELGAWLRTPDKEQPDLAAVAARFRAAHADTLAGTARVDELRRRFESVTDAAIPRLLQPVADLLGAAGLAPSVDYYHPLSSAVERTRYLGSTMELASTQRWVTAEYGRVEWPQKIAIGVGFDVDTEGEFWCTAHVAAGDMESTATRQWQFDEQTVPIESSAALDGALAGLATDVLEALGQALATLAAEAETQ